MSKVERCTKSYQIECPSVDPRQPKFAPKLSSLTRGNSGLGAPAAGPGIGQPGAQEAAQRRARARARARAGVGAGGMVWSKVWKAIVEIGYLFV